MSTKALQRLRQYDRAMVSPICRVKLADKSKGDLHAKLGLCDIADEVRERGIRWYEHVLGCLPAPV